MYILRSKARKGKPSKIRYTRIDKMPWLDLLFSPHVPRGQCYLIGNNKAIFHPADESLAPQKYETVERKNRWRIRRIK